MGFLRKRGFLGKTGAALLNLAAALSILGGTDITGFYAASGYAPFVGQAAMLVWFLVASIIDDREAITPHGRLFRI
jgi:predicted membrane protein